LSAITNGSPASDSSPRNPSWSPYALSAHTARKVNPAARALTARSAPIASLDRNAGSFFPFAKCFAGVYGTACTG
jgi:hypothetical protein